jgi:hypothetical protein
MPSVVGDAKFFFEDFGHAGTGPNLTAKPIGFCAMREKVRDQAQLLRRQFKRPTARRFGTPGFNPWFCIDLA